MIRPGGQSGPKKLKLDPIVNNNDLYFSKKEIPMRLAEIASTRSKFEKNKVGACVVDQEYRILGYGYNGYPRLKNQKNEIYKNRENSNLFKCCAAQNAIHHSTSSVRGATLYVTSFPCEQCAKAIIQTGILKLIYLNVEKDHPNQNHEVSYEMLRDSLGNNLMSFGKLMEDKNYVFKPLTLPPDQKQ